MSYKHFTTADRYRLWFYLNEQRSLSYCAKYLGCSISTVWREITRNRITDAELSRGYINKKLGILGRPTNKYHYDAECAIYKSQQRRAVANQSHSKLSKDIRIRNYIIKRIKQRWSPEQIVGTVRKRGVIVNGKRHDYVIAIQTVYNYIYHYYPELKVYFRHRKRGRYHGSSYHKNQARDDTRSIDLRPKDIDARLTIGHWEGDTIMGDAQGKTGRIATFVERKSGFLMAVKIPGYTPEERAMDRKVRQELKLNTSFRFASNFIQIAKKLISPKYLKTLTLDNGPENADYEYIEQSIDGLKIYFAHPYHSWERGTNENTNGLLRQYFPKGTSFANVTQEDIDKAVYEINNRPRKRLNWNTPQKVMEHNYALCTSK